MLVADLQDAPWNFRGHPVEQQDAFGGAVEEIGWYGYPDVYETPDGTLRICDGHLRKSWLLEHYGEAAEIDVNVTDFDERDAKVATMTHDPLAEMAEMNQKAFDELVESTDTNSDALNEMLSELSSLNVDGTNIDDTYTNKIVSPVYEPKGERPPLSALIDRAKTLELMAGIDAAELPDDVKEFLRLAAERHTVFNFRQVAEFYCHADATLQDLMERSGLIIIDFDKAIEYGFVHLTERLGAIADLEKADCDA